MLYRKENIGLSLGYFLSTIAGIDEKKILEYVKFQQSQDLGQAKFELFKSATWKYVGIFVVFVNVNRIRYSDGFMRHTSDKKIKR